MPGLFHGKIADMHGFFVTHWGIPNRGTRNPGSLSFHNTHLHRAPILLSSLPPFRSAATSHLFYYTPTSCTVSCSSRGNPHLISVPTRSVLFPNSKHMPRLSSLNMRMQTSFPTFDGNAR
jgi:hypothetical protein